MILVANGAGNRWLRILTVPGTSGTGNGQERALSAPGTDGISADSTEHCQYWTTTGPGFGRIGHRRYREPAVTGTVGIEF